MMWDAFGVLPSPGGATHRSPASIAGIIRD